MSPPALKAVFVSTFLLFTSCANHVTEGETPSWLQKTFLAQHYRTKYFRLVYSYYESNGILPRDPDALQAWVDDSRDEEFRELAKRVIRLNEVYHGDKLFIEIHLDAIDSNHVTPSVIVFEVDEIKRTTTNSSPKEFRYTPNGSESEPSEGG